MFNELNTLKLFFEDPVREYNVREVARLLKIAPATASKFLKTFEKKGILLGRKERMLLLYKANVESEVYRDLKIYYNLRILKDSGLIEELNKFYLKPTIILYGSFAKGYDVKESDIDLVVISEKNKKFTNLKKYEKKLLKDIQIFVVKSIKDLKNKHLMNNVLNGVVIQGRFEWI